MNIMQVTTVRLRGRAGDVLSANTHKRVTEWLTQWTPRGNFKVAVKPTKKDSLAAIKNMLRKELVPGWLAALHADLHLMFEFEVSEQDTDEAGFFWGNSCVVWSCWHNLEN